MLTRDNLRKTAWNVATKRVKVEVLDKLWEWAKKLLNTDKLNNKLLLAKDDEENAILHNTLFTINVKILERLWKWAKEQLTPEVTI